MKAKNYIDGCEECERNKDYCSECWEELPRQIRDEYIDKARDKRDKKSKGQYKFISSEWGFCK